MPHVVLIFDGIMAVARSGQFKIMEKEKIVLTRYEGRKISAKKGFRNYGHFEVDDEFLFHVFTDENVEIDFTDRSKSNLSICKVVFNRMIKNEVVGPDDVTMLNRVIRGGGLFEYTKKLERKSGVNCLYNLLQ